jgi:hypothetical protein
MTDLQFHVSVVELGQVGILARNATKLGVEILKDHVLLSTSSLSETRRARYDERW